MNNFGGEPQNREVMNLVLFLFNVIHLFAVSRLILV